MIRPIYERPGELNDLAKKPATMYSTPMDYLFYDPVTNGDSAKNKNLAYKKTIVTQNFPIFY